MTFNYVKSDESEGCVFVLGPMEERGVLAHATVMVRERLRTFCRRGNGYYSWTFEMEVSGLTQQLTQIVEVVCDAHTKVKNYGEDSQARMQNLNFKLQLILEWCEGVVFTLKISPPLLLEGLRLDMPILASSGASVMKEASSRMTKGGNMEEEKQN